MAITIVQFFADALEDDEKRSELVNDPAGLVERSTELTETQKRVILSGDLLRLRHVIEYELDLEPDEARIWILFFRSA